MRYTLTDFEFELPPGLIAQVPAGERTASRLLHVAGMRRADLAFTDLPSLLRAGDLVVFNDTRVLHARVFARKSTGGKVELMLERIVADDEAWAQVRASHAPRPGTELALPGGAAARVLAREGRFFRLAFAGTGPLPAWLEQHGEVPLPPYIGRPPASADAARYQTVYARVPGAVAAPTAGLHFDDALLAALAARGVERAFVTLHVGAGTFHPVQDDDLARHRMHAEWYSLPRETVLAVAAARARGARVVAVGHHHAARARIRRAAPTAECAPAPRKRRCSSRRAIASSVVDRLVTNFHLPRSTLLMLVSAFAGFDAIRAAYAHAIAARYRFYSYGDAMLLERDPAAGADI